MKRDSIDFAHVRPEHLPIHDDLLNWALWCSPGGGGSGIQPMFRGYRDKYHIASPRPVECNSINAVATQKKFVMLPELNRYVLCWAYIKPYIPVNRVRQALGLTTPGLSDALHNARTMMKNQRLRAE